jgi:hypothetical protein
MTTKEMLSIAEHHVVIFALINIVYVCRFLVCICAAGRASVVPVFVRLRLRLLWHDAPPVWTRRRAKPTRVALNFNE